LCVCSTTASELCAPGQSNFSGPLDLRMPVVAISGRWYSIPFGMSTRMWCSSPIAGGHLADWSAYRKVNLKTAIAGF